MRLKTLATHPVWREPRTVFGVWMLTGVIFAIVKLLIGKYNNYKIFEGVYWHAIEGLTLYGDHYPEYYDSNHYGVLFSLIIAPFALLPEWLGMILWIAGNTALLFYAISRLPLSSTPKIIIYWYSYCGSRSTAIQYISSGLYLIIICLDTGEKGFLGGRHYYARNIYQDLSNRGIGVLFLLKAESEIISLLSFLGIGLLCDPGALYTGV